MPLGLNEWVAIAAIVSAMCDVINTGRDIFLEFYERRITAPDAMERAATLQQALSTYTDDEIKAINKRLQACRDRFVREGSGPHRRDCLCSVLQDVKDGNGGTIPLPDWEQSYRTLGCTQ